MLVDCEDLLFELVFCFLSAYYFRFLNLLFEICMGCFLPYFSVASLLALASAPTSL